MTTEQATAFGSPGRRQVDSSGFVKQQQDMQRSFKQQQAHVGNHSNNLASFGFPEVAPTGATYHHHPQHFPQPKKRQPPPKRAKLQCLVLGAARAGKTSILRRYFHGTFEHDARVATLGSDFYIGQCEVPTPPPPTSDEKPMTHPNNQTEGGKRGEIGDHNNGSHNARAEHKDEPSLTRVNLQLWDTPGRERFYLNRKKKFTAHLTDNFFRQADAVMLVYDMTSSTSFTQLLRWYADLIEIKKKNNFPILIVGNKLDLFLADQQRAKSLVHPRRVPQREVLGISNDFSGHDFRYEYRVSAPVQPNKSSSANKGSHHRHPSFHENSYLANRENWTTDNSYLESLLNSEDASSPDREMVLLWCMRNGLTHHEASAATGEGIDSAIESMLSLALKAREEQQQKDSTDKEPASMPRKRQEEIDFQERFTVKEEPPCCFCFRPLPQWTK